MSHRWFRRIFASTLKTLNSSCLFSASSLVVFHNVLEMRQDRLLAVTLFATSAINITSCFVVVAAGGVLPPPRLLLGSGDSRTPIVSGRVRRQREHRYHHRLEAKKAKSGKSGRPSLDDIERLSRGQAAKKRGTGSRGVCHRLNESERKVCKKKHVRSRTPHDPSNPWMLCTYRTSCNPPELYGCIGKRAYY